MRVYVFRATYLVEVDDPEGLGEDAAREIVPQVMFGGSDHPFGRIEREDIEYEDDYDRKEPER
jgi:hypothetical protein